MASAADPTQPDDWNKFVAELQKLCDEAFAAFRIAVPTLSEAGCVQVFQQSDAAENFLGKIEKRHGMDRHQYAAYHVLTGNPTFDQRDAPRLDFAGELSVRHYYEDIKDNPLSLLRESHVHAKTPLTEIQP